MFNKKVCGNCGKKINDSYDFCPFCGFDVRSDKKKENWGLLGKDDLGVPREEFKIPGGFNLIFNSLMKNFEKQFREMEKNIKTEKEQDDKTPKMKKQGISINISTNGNQPPVINVTSFGNNAKKKQDEIKKVFSNSFSKEKLKRLPKLPREEPKTNIRRLSNGVVYEIEIPGVKSVKDISMIYLENSTEIKAITDDKVYSKTIQMNEPVDYRFSEGKLFLEFRNK